MRRLTSTPIPNAAVQALTMVVGGVGGIRGACGVVRARETGAGGGARKTMTRALPVHILVACRGVAHCLVDTVI